MALHKADAAPGNEEEQCHPGKHEHESSDSGTRELIH
jgi:hypothetical protein